MRKGQYEMKLQKQSILDYAGLEGQTMEFGLQSKEKLGRVLSREEALINVLQCHSDSYVKNGLKLGVASMKAGKPVRKLLQSCRQEILATWTKEAAVERERNG